MAKNNMCAACRGKGKNGVECLCADVVAPYYRDLACSTDELVLPLPLYYYHVLRVVNGGNVSDIVINNFASLLSFSRCEQEIKIVNTYFWEKIILADGKRDKLEETRGLSRWIKGIFPSPQLEKLKLIIFPINVPGQHWYLGAVDISNKQYLYMDSCGQNYAVDFFIKAALFMELLFMEELLLCTKKKFFSEEWCKKRCITPQQQDSTSCGVAVCLAMESLTARRELNYDQVFVYHWSFLLYHWSFPCLHGILLLVLPAYSGLLVVEHCRLTEPTSLLYST